jgi:hypothetical protein
VLEAAGGLVVASDIGTPRQRVVLKDALIRPAAPLPKLVPDLTGPWQRERGCR